MFKAIEEALGSYVLAWSIYVVASLFFLYFMYRLFKFIPWKTVKHVLLLIMAVFLLYPVQVLDDQVWLAPACFKLAMGILDFKESATMIFGVLKNMAFTSAIVVGLYFIGSAAFQMIKAKRTVS